MPPLRLQLGEGEITTTMEEEMTITQTTGDILTIDELGVVAPDLTVADVFRIAFKDEDGQMRWRAEDVRKLSAEYRAVELTESAYRPAWAGEGVWDEDTITYMREMPNSMVRIDQTLAREGEAWSFIAPAGMYVPGSRGDELDANSARLLIADLTEAIRVLDATV